MTQTPQPDAAAPLLELARARRFDDLESAWMTTLEEGALALDDLRRVLQELYDQHETKALESLLWLLVSTWAERQGPDEALEAVWQTAGLLPESDVLRDELAGLYRQAHASAPGIETLLEMTLLRRDLPIRTALERLEKLLGLPPGTYIADPRRRSPGRILAVDPVRKVLTASFGDSERAYDAVSIENVEAGEADDFRAIVVFDVARLQALAADDPAELARLVLKAHGPHLAFKEFRSLLAPVVPAEAWSKWWSGARAAVRRSPLIETSDGTQPSLFLRARPLAYDDRARADFDEARTLRARLLAVLAYLKESRHDPAAEAETLAYFDGKIGEALAAGGAPSPAEAIAAWAVLAEMRRRRSEASAPGAAAGDGRSAAATPPEVSGADLADALAAADDERLAQSILAFVRERLADRWPDVYLDAMPASSPDLCEVMAAELAGAGFEARLAGAAEAILRRPDESVGALLWLWKAVTADRYAQALGGVNRVSMTIRLLLAADGLGLRARDEKALRPLVAQIRSTLSAKDGEALRAVLETADDRQAKDIRAAMERNAALTDVARSRLLDLVRKTHPSHFVVRTLPPWEEDALYTTQPALRRQEEVYGELVSKKVLDNQRAIAAAAEHGDVSDNAEFTSALEERDRLAEQAARLQADIAKARIITLGMAESETVTVGSRVRARNLATGEEETLVFLGPWETDLARHVYFYRAPLALAFMGKAVGDTVTLHTESEERKWEVLEIGPGI